jgi:hypothetical protein
MKVERRFLLLISIGDQCGQQIHNEVRHAAVACMLDLTNVLELIIDRLAQSILFASYWVLKWRLVMV